MTENIYKSVEKNELGYYELLKCYQKSTNEFYETEYYQNDNALYKKSYSPEEIVYMNNLFREKEHIIKKLWCGEHKFNKFLDIGCGEGACLKYFFDRGWLVKGIDYSDYGIKTHNPDMINNLIKGDAIHCISNMDESFDFINMDNVLEHLPNPIDLFKVLKKICNENTILCAKVPNDFSLTQIKLYENKCIDNAFWVTEDSCEHFNYFTPDSLNNFIENNSYQTLLLIGDWPIDFNLFNPHTNYITNKEVGAECHNSRIVIENMLFEQSLEKTLTLHKSFADLGIGRNISVYFKLKY